MNNSIILFSGPGGTSSGFKKIGLDSVGIEIDKNSSESARANGFEVINKDVTSLNPVDFMSTGSSVFLQASPPCQGFSVAGLKAGRGDMYKILDALANMESIELAIDYLKKTCDDERSHLILEPLRWLKMEPEYIMLEQVISVLPIWEAMAGVLKKRGYFVWVGKISAETFGVPQVRPRAILLASKHGEILPIATHSKYNSRNPDVLEQNKLPWVSMSDVLNWDEDDKVGFLRRADAHAAVEINGISYRQRDLRSARYPSLSLTEKARSWTRYSKEPHRLELEEALLLQSFDRDYKLVGSRTSKFLQIGNALPPELARVLALSLLKD